MQNRATIALLTIASKAAQASAYTNWPDEFSRKEISTSWKIPNCELISLEELKATPKETLYSLGFANWDDNLVLIPLWIYHHLESNMLVTCITGETSVLSECDLDVRGGCIAYGFIPD